MSDNRYLRHDMIDWFDQDRVRRLSVIIVGAGAVGNEVIKNLALLGVGRIHIVDFDRIEIHNLTRNVLFDEGQVGRPKAEIAALAGKRLNPETEFTHAAGDFWDCVSLEDIGKADAVLCCVDNFTARIRLNKLCLIAGTDLYDAAIDSRFVSVESYPFSTNPESACYECNLPLSVYTRLGERYSCGWLKKRSFQEKKVPTTVLTAGLAASAMCSRFLHRHHRDLREDAEGSGLERMSRLFFDTITEHASVSHAEKNPDCPACSAITPQRFIFKTKSRIKKNIFLPFLEEEPIRLAFSDQVVLEANCLVCGHKEELFVRADRHDDSLVLCPQCGSRGRDFIFADEMDSRTLEEKWVGKKLPVKFVFFEQYGQQFYLELEDSHD